LAYYAQLAEIVLQIHEILIPDVIEQFLFVLNYSTAAFCSFLDAVLKF